MVENVLGPHSTLCTETLAVLNYVQINCKNTVTDIILYTQIMVNVFLQNMNAVNMVFLCLFHFWCGNIRSWKMHCAPVGGSKGITFTLSHQSTLFDKAQTPVCNVLSALLFWEVTLPSPSSSHVIY